MTSLSNENNSALNLEIEFKDYDTSIFENEISKDLISKDDGINFNIEMDFDIAVPTRKPRKFKLLKLQE